MNVEHWKKVIGDLVAAIIPIAITYGLLSATEAELWANLVLVIAAIVLPLVVKSSVEDSAKTQRAAIYRESVRVIYEVKD
jgi:hypothetical protein